MTFMSSDAGLLARSGWILIEFIWQGALVAFALSLALRISRKDSAVRRYAICCFALGAMVLSPALTAAGFAFGSRAQLPVTTTSEFFRGSAPAAAIGQLARRYDSAAWIAWLDRHTAAIVVVWSIGVFLAILRVVLSLVAAQRLKVTAMHPAPQPLQASASQLAARLCLSRPPLLVLSKHVTAPVVVGWRSPAILLPHSCLAELSPEQVEAVLTHELAHIRRRDYLVNLLQAGVEAAFFYHPAVWWASRQIRREREHCCDDQAVLVSGSALTYAKALTALEERRSGLIAGLTLGAYGGNLLMRIKRLFDLSPSAPASRRSGFSLASLGTITAVFLVLLSLSLSSRISAQTAHSAAEQNNGPKSSATHSKRPDLSCTYYSIDGSPHPGTCEAPAHSQNDYLCRQDDGQHLAQAQSGCEWKVQRLRAWEKKQSNGNAKAN